MIIAFCYNPLPLICIVFQQRLKNVTNELKMMTKYIGILAGIAYVILGALLLLTHPLTEYLDLLWQNILGGLMVVYGLFRIWSRFNKNA
jgi:membrane-bound ClpP family serine protease